MAVDDIELPAPISWATSIPVDGQDPARIVAEEVAVALTYQGATHAVMMATPAALHDFALGFSLTEGIITDPGELYSVEVVARPNGIELRLAIAPRCEVKLQQRRRRMMGPLGCGLCGLESLDAAMRPSVPVPSRLRIAANEIPQAMAQLSRGQALHHLTRCMHAAGFWVPEVGLRAVREDVGRHNALDKLIGCLARDGIDAGLGVMLLTSRISVELVQKAAVFGAPVLVAASAPTALAIRVAEACGITLVGSARGETFTVFSHPERLNFGAHCGGGTKVAGKEVADR